MTEIVIKVNKKSLLIKWGAVWFVALLLTIFRLYTMSLEQPQCENLFGVNVSYLNLLFLVYILPIFMFVVSLPFSIIGFKEAKHGVSPPQGSFAFFKEKRAKTGVLVRVRGGGLVLAPIFCIYIVSLGDTTYKEITKGSSYTEVVQIIEAGCKVKA